MKYIISDMDGTIISHDIKNKICDETINSINNLEKNEEIIFNIATGRHYANVLDLLDDYKIKLSKKSFVIGMNGSQIYSIRDKKLIFSKYINKEEVKRTNIIDSLYDEYQDNILIFGYSSDNEIFYVDKGTKTFEELKNYCSTYENITKSLTTKNIKSIDEINEICKFMIFLPTYSEMKEVTENIKKKFPSFSFVKSGPNYLEVIRTDVNKSTAIKYINDNYFKASKEDLISFGDSDNDLEMFSYTGTSYTRKDADEHIKNSATIVMPHLASYFVHYAIEDVIKKIK